MSLRLKFLNLFLKATVKSRLKHLTKPNKARLDLERAARWVFRPVPLTLTLPIKLVAQSGKSYQALSIWNRPTRSDFKPGTTRPIIFYLHGGGYIAGSPNTHAKMLARLSRLTGLEVITPWYRLAPEHPFPAGFKDAEAAFEALLERGYFAENIIIGGDSAGGGIAFALLAKLCQKGTPPRAIFGLSPLVDMSFQGASFQENHVSDPILPAEQHDLVANMYLNGHCASDPIASPLLAEIPKPPPTFLQFSNTEILRDDSLRMAQKLKALGGKVTLDKWDSTPHVWVLFDGILPEAREGIKRIARFIRETNSAQ